MTTSNVSGVTVTLSATDTLSGVASTYYTVNGGPQQTYSVPFAASLGSNSVSYWSTDKAGNIEVAHTLSLNVTAPVTTATPTGTAGSNGWYTSQVAVTLAATAGTLPVASTYYTVDGGGQQTYVTPFTVTGDGTHSVTYWSVDSAGNAETAHTLNLKIDSTPPVVTYGPITPAPNAKGWNNTAVSVVVTATDATSGLLNFTSPNVYYFTAEGTGLTLSTLVRDNAYNATPILVTGVNIDETPPTTTSSVSGTTITLTATDTLSGVAATYYTVNGGSSQTYATPFAVALGTNAITYWSVDNAGNIESSHTINLAVASSATTASTVGTVGTNGWYKSAVTVTLHAVAGTLPVANTYYTVDGGAQQTYATPFAIVSDGTHTLTYWSVDTGGNVETAHSLIVKIDATKPTVTFGAITPAPNANGWNKSSVTVPFTASDATSGVASTSPLATTLTFTAQAANQTQTVTVTDNAGNSATFTSPPVSIDTTAPKTTYAVSGTTISLTATDNLSGIAATYYTVDGSAPVVYTVPVAITAYGTHAITYWSVDAAGNVEGAHTTSLNVNYPKPSISSETASTLYLGVTTTQTITLTGTNFLPVSVANWNGVPIPTTYVSATSLTATVDPSLLTTVASIPVTVSNPTPGGGTSGSKTVKVALPTLTKFSFSGSVNGGSNGTATLTINSPAPAGYTATLTSTDTPDVTLPSTVAFATGATTATFAIPTNPVAANVGVGIVATGGGKSYTETLTIKAAAVSKVAFTGSVYGGTSATVTVTLNGPAAAGYTATLSSSLPAVASPPATVTFVAGATTATAVVTTAPVSTTTSVTITAVGGGATKTTTLSVKAPTLSSFSLSPTSVKGGSANSTGTITISSPASSSGVAFTVTSSAPSAAAVLGTATVAAGATTATFTVTTAVVATTTSSTITVAGLGSTKTATLSVTH